MHHPFNSALIRVLPSPEAVMIVGGDLGRFVLAWFDPGTETWQILLTSVNDDGTLSAPSDRSGTLVVLLQPATALDDGSAEAALAEPNAN